MTRPSSGRHAPTKTVTNVVAKFLRRIVQSRLVVTALVPVVGAIAFGVAATLVSDWIHGWLLPAVTVVLLGALAALVVYRDHLSSSAGTLFYVRVGDQWMRDWHLEQLKGVVKSRMHLDAKVVSYDFVRTKCPDPAWVDDVEPVVSAAAAELARQLNDDSTETAYHLIPNMLWPSAVAVGYALFDWDKLTLHEYTNKQEPQFDMRLGDRRHFNVVPTTRMVYPPGEGPAVAAVTVHLTPRADPASQLDGYRVCCVTRVAVFPDDNARPDAPNAPVVISSTRSAPGNDPTMSPWSATEATVTAIRTVIHAHPDRPVLVSLSVPKAVAVAVGHALRSTSCGTQGCTAGGCRNPWEVIVPMNWEMVADPLVYTPLRVHPHQPPAGEMSRRLRPCLT